MIPPLEEAILKQDIACALELADAGEIELGYRILDHALGEAEALGDAAWVESLVGRYRLAVVLFAQGYGLSFPNPPAADALPTPPAERARALVAASSELRSTAESLRVQSEVNRQRAAEARSRSQHVRQCRPRPDQAPVAA